MLPTSICRPSARPLQFYLTDTGLFQDKRLSTSKHQIYSTSPGEEDFVFDLELGVEIQRLKKKELIWIYQIRFALLWIILFAVILGYLFKYYEVYEEMQTQRQVLLIQYQDCHFHLGQEEASWFETLISDNRLSRCIEAKKEIIRLNLLPNPFEVLLTHYIFPIFQFSWLTTCLVIIISLLLLIFFVPSGISRHKY